MAELTRLAIMVLGPAAMPLAQRLRTHFPASRIHALASRHAPQHGTAEVLYADFGEELRRLHAGPDPVLALCAAGIIIRALAPNLIDDDKQQGAPVLALAPDGSSVVPLLGGLQGANALARQIASLLQAHAAITTSGELRFGTCLLQPPPGYQLADIDQGKRIVSDLLAGGSLQLDGEAPWLQGIDLPQSAVPSHRLRITPHADPVAANELRIYPRTLVLALRNDEALPAAKVQQRLQAALARHELAEQAVGLILMPADSRGQQAVADAAQALQWPLRLCDELASDAADFGLPARLPQAQCWPSGDPGVVLLQLPNPAALEGLGRPRGRLSVIGLGPGHRDFMLPAASQALAQASDILGYATYVNMAGPLQPQQRSHPSDNREELQRARHAFELAAAGRQVAMVSSGDPGIFAMAAAVLEALEASDQPAWHEVELHILPGLSAAMATAALAGAPLGHDFCLLSLSDNLKPWTLIEQRLQLAAEADLVIGLYNPVSRHRPWQLGRALELIRARRGADTPVLLGRDIARPGASLRSLPLQQLQVEMVDMRTVLIIGSSTTRRFARGDGGDWVYTPRSYPAPRPD